MSDYLGYEPDDNEILETGYQKIAIYIDSNSIPTHAARQLPNGKWTSKLGWLEDIEHEVDGLIGERYGVVGQILKLRSSLVLLMLLMSS